MKRAIFTFFASFLVSFSGAQMLPDSIEYYDYDTLNQQYQNDPRETRIYWYDQDGNVSESRDHLAGLNWERKTYVYSNGKRVDEIYYGWNASISTWYPSYRIQEYSNQFGIDTAEIHSIYSQSNQSWIEMKRNVTAVEYDLDNRPTFTTYKEYDAITSNWTFDKRVEFIYSGADTLPSELYVAYWNKNNGTWSNAFWLNRIEWGLGFRPDFDDSEITLTMMSVVSNGNWTEYFYDSSSIVDGNVVDYFAYWYDQNSGTYQLEYSRHDSFDSMDNIVRRLELEWANGQYDTSSWVLRDIVYGSSGEIRTLLSRVFRPSTGMRYGTKAIYYYGVTSVVFAKEQAGTLYPNPLTSSQKLLIRSELSVEQVQLYSVNGALLRSWDMPGSDGLEIQGLAPGMYFVRLLDEAGNSTTQRLIIK